MAILKVFKNKEGNRVFFYLNQEVRDITGWKHGTKVYVKKVTPNSLYLEKAGEPEEEMTVSKTGKERLRMTITREIQSRIPLEKDDIFVLKQKGEDIALVRMISMDDCLKIKR